MAHRRLRLYTSLGSPHLSQLIEEEYELGTELSDSTAAEVRELVLERLPLFLHERREEDILIKVEWMQNPSYVTSHRIHRY